MRKNAKRPPRSALTAKRGERLKTAEIISEETRDQVFAVLNGLFHVAETHYFAGVIGILLPLHRLDFVVPACRIVFLEDVGEIIPSAFVYALVALYTAGFESFPRQLLALFVAELFLALVVAQNIGGDNLIGLFFPATFSTI